jgi:exosortase A-associated hydrolase 1
MQGQGEVAFAFSCQGDDLIGFLHNGNQHCAVGVLTLVAGGPQYRGGVGRQLVNLGRRLAAEGIPVMRFDHRGMGDSEGTFRRFNAMQDDIAAAIDEFKRRAPHVRAVILWGGCDSATAALINAYKFSEVICVIAGNPFVSSQATATKAARKHYRARLLQASFWIKLVKLEYRLGDYATAALRKLCARGKGAGNEGSACKTASDKGDFLTDLLTGLRNFNGKVLFLMGDRFLLSDEFDALMASSPQWRAAYGKTTFERIDIKDGDQVFSTTAAQERMFDAASTWIHGAFPDYLLQTRPSGRRKSVQTAEAL